MKKKCIVCKRSKAGNYYDAFDHEDFAREIRAAVEETLSSYHRLIACEACIERIRIKLVNQGLNLPTAPAKVVKSRIYYKGPEFYKLSEEQKKIYLQTFVQPQCIFELHQVQQNPVLTSQPTELFDNPPVLTSQPTELFDNPPVLTSQPLELVDNSPELTSQPLESADNSKESSNLSNEPFNSFVGPVSQTSFKMFKRLTEFKKPMPLTVKRRLYEEEKKRHKRFKLSNVELSADGSSKETSSNSTDSRKTIYVSNSLHTQSFNNGQKVTSTQSFFNSEPIRSTYQNSLESLNVPFSEAFVSSIQTGANPLSQAIGVSVRQGHMRVLRNDSDITSDSSETASFHPIVLNDDIISGNASNYSNSSGREHSNVAGPSRIRNTSNSSNSSGREHSNVAAPSPRITHIRKRDKILGG